MFNEQERWKSKYKYGGTNVCKAEEVKKNTLYILKLKVLARV